MQQPQTKKVKARKEIYLACGAYSMTPGEEVVNLDPSVCSEKSAKRKYK